MAKYEIRKSMVETKLEKVMESLGLDRGKAFERMVYSWIFGVAPNEVPPEDNVDGGQDKQIDFIVIEDRQDEGRATVNILQVKAQATFSSNALIQMHHGLRWVWLSQKAEYSKLSNARFKLKIQEVRELLNNYGPSNLDVRVYFVTTGDLDAASEEFQQESTNLTSEFADVFRSFKFLPMGANELIDLVNRREQSNRSIDANIAVVYDVNKPSLIKFSAHGLQGVVFTVTGRELGRLVDEAPNQSIFDKNIRPYLGKNDVNQEICRTCTSEEEAKFFWFLNNGVTMVCDSFDVVQDPDNPHVKAKNLQIVNGCQTSTTLAEALNEGILQPATNVLVKIYATTDAAFVEKITFSTNSQTAISARDLKANEQVQKDLQRLFLEKYGVYYERKINEFAALSLDPKRKNVSNERVGQAYLAVGMRKPTVARAQKYKVFKPEFYEDIFVNSSPAALYYSWAVYHFTAYGCSSWALVSGEYKDEHWAAIAYGGFHLARILGALLMGGDAKWNAETMEEVASGVLEEPNAYRNELQTAFDMLVKILMDRPQETAVANYFKTAGIQGKINEALAQIFKSGDCPRTLFDLDDWQN